MIVGFKWIVEGSLAGSGQPGLYTDVEDDLDFIKSNGLDTVVTLTESPLGEEFNDKDIEIIHFPIHDMGIPVPRVAHGLCKSLKMKLDSGKKILIHCKAGLGRTGTILACVLIEMGYDTDEAIKKVRSHIRMGIQNSLQEGFIQHYFEYHHMQAQKEL